MTLRAELLKSKMGIPGYMKKTVQQFTVMAAALVSAAAAAAVVTPPTLNVIPQPVSVQMRSGSFRLRPGTRIVVTAGKPEVRQAGAYLANAMAAPTGWRRQIVEAAKPLARPNVIEVGAWRDPRGCRRADHPAPALLRERRRWAAGLW